MIRDRFDAVDASLKAAKDSFDKHADTDAKYWAKIDEHHAQVGLIKKILYGVTVLLGALGTWLGLHR